MWMCLVPRRMPALRTVSREGIAAGFCSPCCKLMDGLANQSHAIGYMSTAVPNCMCIWFEMLACTWATKKKKKNLSRFPYSMVWTKSTQYGPNDLLLLWSVLYSVWFIISFKILSIKASLWPIHTKDNNNNYNVLIIILTLWESGSSSPQLYGVNKPWQLKTVHSLPPATSIKASKLHLTSELNIVTIQFKIQNKYRFTDFNLCFVFLCF